MNSTVYITMKYVNDNEILIFEFYICTMFSMSRFWVLCHLLPLPLPLLFCVILLLATVNGLAFRGSLQEAMMSGVLFNSLYHYEIYTTMNYEFYMQCFTISRF